MPPNHPSGLWQVDLGYSVNVSMVILRVGPGGLNHAAITVGDKPTPSGEPCATVDSAAANTTAALRCNDSGQYLHVTASPAFTGSCVSLCSLSVYPRGEAPRPSSPAGVGKPWISSAPDCSTWLPLLLRACTSGQLYCPSLLLAVVMPCWGVGQGATVLFLNFDLNSHTDQALSTAVCQLRACVECGTSALADTCPLSVVQLLQWP